MSSGCGFGGGTMSLWRIFFTYVPTGAAFLLSEIIVAFAYFLSLVFSTGERSLKV